MINIMLVDDDLFIRESLEIIINIDDEIKVTAKAENGKQAIELYNDEIDVVLLDIRMPIMNGIECLKILKQTTSVKVLLLTTFDEDDYILEAIKSKVDGYLLKNSDPNNIKSAIKAVYNGNVVLDETIINKMEIKSRPLLKDFSQREKEIIELIADGMSNKQISSNLNISEGTVKNYITNILDKSNLEHRTQIAIHYLKGLL